MYVFLLCSLKLSCGTVVRVTIVFSKLCLCLVVVCNTVVGYHITILLSSLDLNMELMPYLTKTLVQCG